MPIEVEVDMHLGVVDPTEAADIVPEDSVRRTLAGGDPELLRVDCFLDGVVPFLSFFLARETDGIPEQCCNRLECNDGPGG